MDDVSYWRNNMIRQQAFEGGNKMLKGGLHCHTTRSDGAGTPEAVIKRHYECGYDFMALTDHDIYNYASYAPELPITILPAMEISCGVKRAKGVQYHDSVCIGKRKESGNGFEQDEAFPFSIIESHGEFQEKLDKAHERNNITFYCHPQWSSTYARDIEGLKGIFAIEVWNSGGVLCNYTDMDAFCWDELLRSGLKWYGVATDDGHAMSEHCHGWVMVNSQNDIDSIVDALAEGRFYSSCGPEIYDFYVDGDKCVIECSEVSMIRLHSDGHPVELRQAPEGGSLTRAEFTLWGGESQYDYVRITVTDKDGKHAWTNPIWFK